MPKAPNRFFTIGVKLFLSFWLITLVSILTTRMISEQFRTQGFIVPTHHFDSAKLKRLSRIIAEQPLTSPEEALTVLPKRKGKALLLKNMQTQEVISTYPWHISELNAFLENNNLETTTTVQFKHTRMTGPLLIYVKDVPYQLFIASRDRNARMGSWIFDLPPWTRIAIPLLISLILYWLIARSLTKPLIAMQQATAKFGDGELSTRVSLKAQRNDEIADCAMSFNLMADKLEQNIEAHQRLLADVSHELRSPMTRLQIALGLAQQKGISEDILNKHLQRCELEVIRLDDMITNVLTLSRLENTINKMELMSVDVEHLITLCVEDAQYIADKKSVKIHLNSKDRPIIQADPNLLSSAISNILNNAVKYSPESSSLETTLVVQKNKLVIRIVDHGIGVPAEELKNLFEPFYRVAHARDRETGGTGLGMAIAKQAVVAHNGTIKAENNQHNGLTVIIELPIKISKNG